VCGGRSSVEREVLRFAMLAGRPIKPIELVHEFSLNHRTAVKILKRLCDKGKLEPVVRGTSGRIARYEWKRSLEDDSLVMPRRGLKFNAFLQSIRMLLLRNVE
jgi:hypothetical protein